MCQWTEEFFLFSAVRLHHIKKRILNREKGDSDNLNVSLKSLCNSLSWIHCVNWRKQLLFSAFFVWIISKPFNFKSILQKCHRWLQVKKTFAPCYLKVKIQNVFTIEHVHFRQFITFSNQYDTKLYDFFAFKHPVILSSSNCSYLIPLAIVV